MLRLYGDILLLDHPCRCSGLLCGRCWRGTTSRFAVRQNFCRGRMQNHVADHADQLRMRACRSGADHLHTKLVTQRSRFRIQVVEHFHVIGNKSNGTDDHAANAGGVLLAQIIANIGRKPRLRTADRCGSGKPASSCSCRKRQPRARWLPLVAADTETFQPCLRECCAR